MAFLYPPAIKMWQEGKSNNALQIDTPMLTTPS